MICGFALKKIPDFLLDYTLLPEQQSDRLPEHGTIWRKFLQRLWTWKGTTFCFRFVFRPRLARTDCFLLARPADPEQLLQLQADLDFALRAFGIVSNTRNLQNCVPLLPDRLLEDCDNELTKNRVRKIAHEYREIALGSLSEDVAIAGLIQRTACDVWNRGLPDIDSAISEIVEKPVEDSKILPWIPQLWAGPSGSFLLPFRSLFETQSETILSIYVQPTQLDNRELGFIDIVRAKALLKGRTQDEPDLGAELLANISNNCYSRLVSEPWLIAIDCASTGGLLHEAESVLKSISASIHRDEISLELGQMPGTEYRIANDAQREHAIRTHSELRFPTWTCDTERPREFRRLDYLTDALGAATVFRLPANVRGGIPGLDVVQMAPDRIPSPEPRVIRKNTLESFPLAESERSHRKQIFLGSYASGSPLYIDSEQFTKHALITGFTGSGKTTTVLQILHQLWHLSGDMSKGPNGGGVPFLVIEAAKKEYRGLTGVKTFFEERIAHNDQLLVCTVGNESCAPFRLNPFAILPGLRVETHVSRLQSCFEAALPPLPYLPSILTESLEKAYKRKFWVLTDICESNDRLQREFPTMKDFYLEVEIVVNSRGYQGDVGANVRAAILGRIKQLLMGSTGFIFAHSNKTVEDLAKDLFERPMILELNDLNLQDKALMMMFVLTMLREYRELNPSRKLCHVTVVEEAHNVLGEVESEGKGESAGSDIRAKSVEYFCNMLAEMRSLGQGLIISDQSPNKLARDAMRNTNVQIAHQLRDSHDRETVANAMIMDPEQRDFLGKLKPGKAAIFRTGLEKAAFASILDYRKNDGQEFFEELPDFSDTEKNVKEMMAPFVEPAAIDHPFTGCQECGHNSTCDYRKHSAFVSLNGLDGQKEQISDCFAKFNKLISKPGTNRQNTMARNSDTRKKATKQLLDICVQLSEDGTEDSVWCLLLHLYNQFGPELDRRKITDLVGKDKLVDRYFQKFRLRTN